MAPRSVFWSTGHRRAISSPFARAVFLFDGSDQEAVADARLHWKRLKGEGHDLTYWQQAETGRWERKA